MPEVSVVIPAYNAQRTLGKTLESVFSQSFDDLEVIVIDDGSTDSTSRIAGSTGDPRVRVVRVANGGVARARSLGIHEARGEFISFLDADDIWRPSKLARQVTLLRARPEVGMCFTAAVRVDDDMRRLEEIPAREQEDYCAALLLKSVIISGSCSSGMVRRAVALNIGGFDSSFSQCADWDFWLRLSRVTDFAPIREPLVLYRTSGGNMSRNIALLERDTLAVLDKFFADPASTPYLRLYSRAYSNHLMICSGSYLHAGQLWASLRCLGRSLAAHPGNIRRPLGLPKRWIRRLTTTAGGRA